MQRRVPDVRRAEAYTIIMLALLALSLLLANYVAWGLLEARILADPEGPIALWFWAGQVAAVVVAVGVAVIGFKPAIEVVCGADGIAIETKKQPLNIARADIQSFETISATLFHRHYRRYAATHIFVNHIPETLLLLHTTQGPVVLGLSDHDLSACILHLNVLDQAFFMPSSAAIA